MTAEPGVAVDDAAPTTGRAPASVGPPPPRPPDPFWPGVRESVLVLNRCASCGRCYVASPACVACGAAESEPVIASGQATLYSWTTTWLAFDPSLATEVPYVVGVVDLAEGCRIPARVVVDHGGELAAGMPLRLEFEAVEGGLRWVFRAVSPAGSA